MQLIISGKLRRKTRWKDLTNYANLGFKRDVMNYCTNLDMVDILAKKNFVF